MKHLTTRRRAAALAAVAFVSLASCGGDPAASDTTVAPATTVAECTGAKEKIVSLSPTATEMIYAIGAGDSIVALDSLSTYPAEASSKVTKLSGFEPNAEAVLAYGPDAVLISYDPNKFAEHVSAASPDTQVWTGGTANSIDDVYSQITALGDLTCRQAEAATLVEEMKSGIAAATEGVTAPEGSSYYYELDNTYFSITSGTFIGSLLAPTGIANIADGVEEGNNWPQLNAESIVKSNPSVIFLADTKCCGQTADKVAARSGWGAIDAVKNAHVVELDDDIASRWGPRVVDLVEAMAGAVKGLAG